MIDPDFDFPGWTTAVDPRTGRQYFINLMEKTTSWEDPRTKYRQQMMTATAIPMQNLHGSPKKSNVQVYPTQSNFPAQAFQANHSGHSVNNASPIPSTKTSHHNSQHHVEMSSLSRSSPHTPRIGSLIKHQQMLQQQTQETSFSNPTPVETDATVAKINSMFPTASDPHIRLLLKKYHNREAVVISALQVEKHPLTTPGPYTPPVTRSFHSTAMALAAFNTPPSSSFGRKSVHHLYGDHLTMTSSSHGSPVPMRPQSSSSFYTNATTTGYGSPRYGEHFRNSPKPHSSPKMKLRYLKSMFPKADEAIILDVLAMVDNNVQKASEQLVQMGYEKKDITPAPRLSHRKKEEQKKQVVEPTPPPKPKTLDEKKKLKARLQNQYKDIPEKIIAMALESVEYSEDKALRILDIVLQEDKETKNKSSEKDKKRGKDDDEKIHVSFKEPSLKSPDNVDLDKAAAIENDETMIINSDHSIITTPVEAKSPRKKSNFLHPESDDTTTSDASSNSIAGGKKHRPKNRGDSMRQSKSASEGPKKDEKSSDTTSNDEQNKDERFMSICSRTYAKGSNPGLIKGPKDDLLLTDYVTWNGANPDIAMGHKIKASGSNSAMRIDRAYPARGRTSELCKGPQVGLAKGSMYLKIPTRANVACN